MGSYSALLILLAILTVIALNPITWIIVTVVLIASSNSKKKKAAAQLGQGTNAPKKVAPPPKPANPMAKWNWLLYIGSFLIVLAMMYFIKTINDSYVAPSTIVMTLLIYICGIILHKKIDYLRPVAKAFVYSALCMIPLWIIAFADLGVPEEATPLFASLSFAVAAFVGAYFVEDKVMGHIAFVSVVPFLWSFSLLLDIVDDTGFICYIIYLAPMVAATLPAALYLTGAQLSDTFNEAARNIGIALWTLAYCFSLLLFIIPSIGTVAPYLRTVCALFAILYSFAFWHKTKKRAFRIILRLAIQTLFLAGVADILNFSMGLITSESDASVKAVLFIGAWLLSFAAQVLYSLYCKKATKDDEKAENALSIASMICVFFAPGLCIGLPNGDSAILWSIVCALLAVFGVAYATHYGNVSWSIVTAVSVMLLPFVIGNYAVSPKWHGDAYMLCYIFIAILFLFGIYTLQKIQKKETQTIGAISICAACLAIVTAAADIEFVYLGYILSAVFLAGFALIAEMHVFYEVATYVFAIGLYSMTDNLLAPRSTRSFSAVSDWSLILQIIHAHIIIAAFICTQLLSKYLYGKSDKVRFIIGFSLYAVVMTAACSAATSSDIAWVLLFLIEQVVALLYSVAKRETWLIWFSSIEIFIIAFRLTEGFYFLWLGIIGAGLIAVVIWQLSKANRKMQGALPGGGKQLMNPNDVAKDEDKKD